MMDDPDAATKLFTIGTNIDKTVRRTKHSDNCHSLGCDIIENVVVTIVVGCKLICRKESGDENGQVG